MEQALIASIAKRARKAIEKIAETENLFERFPTGCCGNSSDLLAQYFREHHNVKPQYISGTRDDIPSHAWLYIEGLIVDITSDQFGTMGCGPIFVGRRSEFHSSFQEITASSPKLGMGLDDIYTKFLELMRPDSIQNN